MTLYMYITALYNCGTWWRFGWVESF